MPPAQGPTTRLKLVVTEGQDAGKSIPLDRSLLIGTSEVCDLQLTDRTVSRRHLTVEPAELGARLADDGSRNGTWLGDTRVRDADLAPGGTLRIGATVLSLVSYEAPAAELSEGEEPGEQRTSFGRFIGQSPSLSQLYEKLERAAGTDATVLLEGESGTGKELLAEAIHEHSARADGPFVVVDCGAVPKNLIESELFGHERGAFTGAERMRQGAFEQANGGTIFLDELGELPLTLQTRLLRVLDRRQLRRVGSEDAIDIDIRVVAATNRNLDREVEESRFRLDLFHRLAVILIRVPPLRERHGDVEMLARHFVRTYGGDEAELTKEAIENLERYRWPGNVRELRNYMERLVLLGDSAPQLDLSKSDDPMREAARSGLAYRQARAAALEAFTEAYVEDMLKRHGGNVSKAARHAGVARRHFHRLKKGASSD